MGLPPPRSSVVELALCREGSHGPFQENTRLEKMTAVLKTMQKAGRIGDAEGQYQEALIVVDALLQQGHTVTPKPQTLNPRAQTLNLTPQTLNPTPQTLNPTPQTSNLKVYTLNPNSDP